jgi:shikimate dehydrogenase
MRLFGLVGFPLGHSWSPGYFNQRFREEIEETTVYKLFPLPSEQEIPRMIRNNEELVGFNVTIPFKEKILRFLDETDPLATATGSVNLVLIDRTRHPMHLKGFNTDAPAFESSLPSPLTHTHALVLGTGGSSRSVAYVLKKLGVELLHVSRHPGKPGSVTYEELHADRSMLKKYTLIINTTPLGMFPDVASAPPIPYGQLTPVHFLYDLVYNPEVTTFLQKGAEHGTVVQSGKDLFFLQAALSYSLFTGNRL